jgi:DNA-binding XRE family transcriptional regulator
MESYTYFAQAVQTGLIKIGHAGDVERRLKSLRSTSPDELKLLGVVSEKEYTEATVHLMFAPERTHGEWFKPSARLMEFIKKKTVPWVRPKLEKAWLPPVGTRLRTPGLIGNLILGHRKAAGLTQADFAEQIGTSRQWVIALERGHHRAELGLVLRALNVLNIPLGIVENKPEEPSLIDEVLNRCKAK